MDKANNVPTDEELLAKVLEVASGDEKKINIGVVQAVSGIKSRIRRRNLWITLPARAEKEIHNKI